MIPFFNKEKIIFTSIVILGSALRMFYALKDIFPDEVLYTEVARINTFLSLIKMNHWLKDHGQLYLIFLKIAQYITTDIVILRLSSILIYVIISFALYLFFRRFNKDIFSLVPVFLFSFLPYFVFLNSYVSPYNFVTLFSILALIFLSDFILSYSDKKNNRRDVVLFLTFSTLAFYSDYSVVYFYISLTMFLFVALMWDKKLAIKLLLIGFLNMFLILPGLYLLFKNLKYFSALSHFVDYVDRDFSTFIVNFTNLIFVKANGFSLLIVILFISFLFFLSFWGKNKNIKYLSFLFAASFIGDGIFLYLFNKFYLLIFSARIFWYFYLLLALGLSILVIGFNKYNFRKLSIFILLISVSVVFLKFQEKNTGIDEIFWTNIEFKNFVKQVENNKNLKNRGVIIFFTNDYYITLTNYYLQGINYQTREEKKQLENFMKNKKIEILENIESIDTISPRSNETLIFVLVNRGYGDNDVSAIKKKLRFYEKDKGIEITDVYYRLNCLNDNCFLYEYYSAK